MLRSGFARSHFYYWKFVTLLVSIRSIAVVTSTRQYGCPSGSLRLHGDDDSLYWRSGYLQLCDGVGHRDRACWKQVSVCSSEMWTTRESQVVCRQLGLSDPVYTETPQWHPGGNGVDGSELGSDGSDESQSHPEGSRSRSGNSEEESDSTHSYRHSNGDEHSQSNHTADSSSGSRMSRSASTGSNDRLILKEVGCTGNEDFLLDCPIVYVDNCNSQTVDVTVTCSSILPSCNATIREFRLVNGRNHKEGRVEVCYDGHWGTVCDDYWDDTDATVLCRQLGFGHGTAYDNAHYQSGPPNATIVLDDLNCSGDESSLLNCHGVIPGRHNCKHYEDAGAECKLADGQLCNKEGDVQLVGNGNRDQLLEGTVEICTDGHWDSICGDCSSNWNVTEAQVICKQLGHMATGAVPVYDAHFGYGSGILSRGNGVNCSGLEDSLADCPIAEGTPCSCSNHTTDAGVRCAEAPPLRVTIINSYGYDTNTFYIGSSVTLTCDVGYESNFFTGAETFSWTSSCTDCFASTATTAEILNTKALLRKSDAGVHTCTVTRGTLFSDSGRIDMKVVEPPVTISASERDVYALTSEPYNNFVLHCNASRPAVVAPHISMSTTWKCNGENLAGASERGITIQTTESSDSSMLNSSLSVHKAKIKHTCIYKCEVTMALPDGITVNNTATFKVVVTDPTEAKFQLHMKLGVIDCSDWQLQTDLIMAVNDVLDELTDAINEQCADCNFNREDHIEQAAFSTCHTKDNDVTFRATLHSTPNANSSDLLRVIDRWIKSGSSLTVQGWHLELNPNCPAEVEYLNDPECEIVTPSPSLSTLVTPLPSLLISIPPPSSAPPPTSDPPISIIAPVLVVALLPPIAAVIALIVCVYCIVKKKRKGARGQYDSIDIDRRDHEKIGGQRRAHDQGDYEDIIGGNDDRGESQISAFRD